MAYPHSVPETLADGSIHILGLVASCTAAALLIVHLTAWAEVETIVSVSLYAAMIVLSFMASAAYHLLPWDRSRPFFHRMDHAAIYLKIAGTYTPLVMMIGSAFAYVILALIWCVALVGALAKLSFWKTDARGSLALYLAMGWAAVLLIWPMWTELGGIPLTLVAVGGLFYSLGAVFFARPVFRYQNAVWHGFVLVASGCFFAAVTLSVTNAT